MREYQTETFKRDFTVIVKKNEGEDDEQKVPIRVHKRLLAIRDVATGVVVTFKKGRLHYKDSRTPKKNCTKQFVLKECRRMLGTEQGEVLFCQAFDF